MGWNHDARVSILDLTASANGVVPTKLNSWARLLDALAGSDRFSNSRGMMTVGNFQGVGENRAKLPRALEDSVDYYRRAVVKVVSYRPG